ncbi:small subunit processome component 20 homolog [Bradysia coprophila]|uniref:small subunit processome component 20 homolog n=1 Tax=Bradysia coprophila TaxID=38358 RepID=UPI00187DBB1B|nr:small subunit processome component 20 homolog [Bradysia coprophila]
MKNQPHRHKDDNVFKFKSFNDIVSTINLRQNALYQVQDPNVENEEDETNFRQSYLKWTVDNLSEEFKIFQKRISGLVTLEQLLNSKDFVVELLLESLKMQPHYHCSHCWTSSHPWQKICVKSFTSTFRSS